jgi:RNA polymerase sigma-70 factor, ECF subfamily
MAEDRAMWIARALSLNEVEVEDGSRDLENLVSELYEVVRPSLMAYVYQLVGSTHDAEDVIQAAFLKLFDQLSQKAVIPNPRSWLYRVAHNLAIDQIRRVNRRESLVQEWLSDGQSGVNPDSVEESLIQRQRIERSLGMLNERERDCLMLRAEGLSYSEIAEVLGISSKSVSVYLARGLKKFEAKHEKRQ